jgi:ribose 5-phosphate isomerase A
MSTLEAQKLVAQKAASYVKDGMSIGLGSGATTFLLIEFLGEKVKEGLQIKAIASSIRSEALARQVGIPLTDFFQIQTLDLTIDGANEVDPQGGLKKGGGVRCCGKK